jgi:mannosyltransferase OCH1-like enzyme
VSETTPRRPTCFATSCCGPTAAVYLDTDFICQKNIEPLLLADATFVGAGEKPGMLSAGFIAAEPRHPLIGRCRDLINARIDLPQVQAHTTGPGMITRGMARFLRPTPVLWRMVRSSFTRTLGPRSIGGTRPFPDAYAIHHWSGSWL